MNLEELRSVQRAERQKDSLQHLRDSFYTDVAAYIAQLKDERERAVETADDPFSSDDVRRLTDKIESTTEIANALYERRVGKVVKHASFAAADMATDEDGMTTEERELFEDLVARIRDNRKTVLATLEGGRASADDGSSADSPAVASRPESDGPDTADEPVSATPASEDDAPIPSDAGADTDDLLADALGDAVSGPSSATAEQPTDDAAPQSTAEAGDYTGEPDRPTSEAAAVSDGTTPDGGTVDSTGTDTDAANPATEPGDAAPQSATTSTERSPDTDRTTLRITADVGTVYGVDEREYDLAREDVIDLPTTNAEPLLRKNAAERID